MNKTVTAVVTAGLLMAAGQTSANDLGAGFSWSGNLTVTSDYLLRGFSETDNGPAVQGGFDLEHESGFYLGNWNSNVTYGADESNLEMDLYGGFAFTAVPGLDMDVGVIRYFYPGLDDADFNEFYIGGATSFDSLDADLYVYVTDDYLASDEDGLVADLNLAYSLPGNTYLTGQLGYVDSELFADGGYMFYGVGAGVSYADLDFTVTYMDADEDGAEDGVAFAVSAEF
ncbi:MAG: TorF family putative porin [Aquisalimonadaceae bacterium]